MNLFELITIARGADVPVEVVLSGDPWAMPFAVAEASISPSGALVLGIKVELGAGQLVAAPPVHAPTPTPVGQVEQPVRSAAAPWLSGLASAKQVGYVTVLLSRQLAPGSPLCEAARAALDRGLTKDEASELIPQLQEGCDG